MSDVLFVYLFQENKSYGSKNHLHSSSGVQERRVGHTYFVGGGVEIYTSSNIYQQK